MQAPPVQVNPVPVQQVPYAHEAPAVLHACAGPHLTASFLVPYWMLFVMYCVLYLKRSSISTTLPSVHDELAATSIIAVPPMPSVTEDAADEAPAAQKLLETLSTATSTNVRVSEREFSSDRL